MKLGDKVTERLKKTAYSDVFDSEMGGVVSNELIGRNGCTHYKEREEEFIGLNIEIQNMKTLKELVSFCF